MIKSKRRKNRCIDKWILKLTDIVRNLEKRHRGVKIDRSQNHIELCPIFDDGLYFISGLDNLDKNHSMVMCGKQREIEE